MKKKKVNPRTPTEVLESREYPEREAAYFTSQSINRSGREMVDVSKDSSRYGVAFDEDKINSQKEKDEKISTLHTHPLIEEQTSYDSAMPSEGDLSSFFHSPSERVMKIAQQHPYTGKVAGYIVLRKTKKTPELSEWNPDLIKTQKDQERLLEEHPELKNFLEDLKAYSRSLDIRGSSESEEDYGRRIQRAVDVFAEKYSLTSAYLPEKGYRFKPGLGFVKRKDLGTLISGILFFCGAIFVGTLSLTGNSIGLSSQKFNLSGIIFLAIGLFLLYLYSKKVIFNLNLDAPSEI